MFKVDQKVICVDDKFEREIDEAFRAFGFGFPKEGEIYTVRDVGNGWIRLMEIRNRLWMFSHGLDEIAFLSCRFRPLTHRSQESEDFAEDVLTRISEGIEEKHEQLIEILTTQWNQNTQKDLGNGVQSTIYR